MTTFSAIVPLIGGFCHGASKALNIQPVNILSYTGFETNDFWANNYYSENSEILKDDLSDAKSVDLVVSTCPCAGISSASRYSSVDNAKNDWLYKSTTDVLNFVEPQILVGENSNLLLAERFTPIRDRISDIASQFGYSVSFIRTSTIYHGLPQDRKRSFYVIHKGPSRNEVNLTKVMSKTTETLEDYLARIPYQPTQVIREFTDAEQTVYEYLVDKNLIKDGSITLLQYIHRNNLYDEILPLIKGSRLAGKLERGLIKFNSGSRPFDDTLVIWQGHTGAMMFRNSRGYIHKLNRFITVEDVAWLMGLNEVKMFEGITPKTHNIINQNVPVNTGADIVRFVLDNFM